jgi:hypothetical protein
MSTGHHDDDGRTMTPLEKIQAELDLVPDEAQTISVFAGVSGHVLVVDGKMVSTSLNLLRVDDQSLESEAEAGIDFAGRFVTLAQERG